MINTAKCKKKRSNIETYAYINKYETAVRKDKVIIIMIMSYHYLIWKLPVSGEYITLASLLPGHEMSFFNYSVHFCQFPHGLFQIFSYLWESRHICVILRKNWDVIFLFHGFEFDLSISIYFRTLIIYVCGCAFIGYPLVLWCDAIVYFLARVFCWPDVGCLHCNLECEIFWEGIYCQ